MKASRFLSWAYLPVLAAALLLLVAPFLFQSSYHYRIGTLVLINTLSVLGLVIVFGYAGLVSLGHAAFFGIGAYLCAILPQQLGVAPGVALVAAPVVAGLVAWLIGWPILRLKGPYLAVVTLAFGVLVTYAVNNERWLTNGSDGTMVATLPIRNLMRATGYQFSTASSWYWFAGVIVLIGMFVAINLRQSPLGRAMVAMHSSEPAAGALGVDVARVKLWAFSIGAAYAGLAGALFGQFNQFVDPSAAHLLHSVEFLTMAVLGGATSVAGAFVGAALLTVLPQALTFVHDYESVFIGLIMMLTMVFMGRGLVPSLAERLRGDRDV
jgi:ABC-type branched-chain amino acid transport system, permease component